MDYQTSKSCCKAIRNLLSKGFFLGITLISSFGLVFAYTTTNPLSVDISVTAIVPLTATNNPAQYPDTQPLSPAASGPINMIESSDVAIFRGSAYPGSVISLLKNGVIVTESPANLDGKFEIRLRNLTEGTYTFGVRAEDTAHLKSKLLTFTIYVSKGITTLVEGIFIPPTITTDKVEVKYGDPIVFSGMSVPNAQVKLNINTKPELMRSALADYKGVWSYSFPSQLLNRGNYEGKALSIMTDSTSPYGDSVTFIVGDTNRNRDTKSSLNGFRKKCDLNTDNRVNILDFSIMAFWYKRLGFPDKVDLSSDGRINLTDLSILAYCWTG